MSEITIYADDYENGGDAGLVLSGRCPYCGDTIRVGQSQWWDSECECEINWYIECKIVGYLEELEQFEILGE